MDPISVTTTNFYATVGGNKATPAKLFVAKDFHQGCGRADPINVLHVRGRLQVENTARHRVVQLRKGVQHPHEGWIWSCAGGWSHAFCPAPLTVRDINIHYGQPNSLSAFSSWTCHAWPERRIIRRVPPKKHLKLRVNSIGSLQEDQ